LIAALFILAFLVIAAMAAPRRSNRLPATEQFVLSLLQVAAWVEHTAIALDAAILRYRMERQTFSIEMESTRAREATHA
jgi:hypothetical protein